MTTSQTAARSLRVAVQLHPQSCTYAQLRDACRRVEDLGVDVVFTWDHFFPLHGDANGPHFECWSTLAAWAEQTSTIELGALVTCNSYRNPHLLAECAGTVDAISEGRLILGLGAGWAQRDYVENGYEFGSVASRLADLEAALPVLGKHLTTRYPGRRPPLLLGGAGERTTLRLVAEHADLWHSFTQGDVLQHKIEVLRGHCAVLGRDPGEIEICVGVGGLGRYGGLPGSPEVEGEPLLALGVSMVTMNAVGPEFDLSHVPAWLAWRDEVNAR